ncbi:S-layer homology domain-containing protein [Thermophilibacter mediterraneus]|uniref:S-layer homology domain-containing protein n=1 Tax=Thermophilibacter mediterraneus TaxID=1871031 RepID=UPI000ADFEC97|nr:S-layer homology domain-containing protein [Thermophilibacter mediterraneus]
MSKRLRSCMTVVMAAFFALAFVVAPKTALAVETVTADNSGSHQTPYGTISYMPDSDGFKMTVEVYVNDEAEPVARVQLPKINGGTNGEGVHGNLGFTPESGFYYHGEERSYDLEADLSSAGWNQQFSWVFFGDDELPQKNYSNVLKVYLYTFDEDESFFLNVLARNLPHLKDNNPYEHVEGYTVSYEGTDPITEEKRTYTHRVTNGSSALDFDDQTLPIDTTLTITAICDPGYEASKWYQGDLAHTNTMISGDEGEGTSGYYLGNVITMSVKTALTNPTLEIDQVRQAEKPTTEEDFAEISAEVLVSCDNRVAEHGDKKYPMSKDAEDLSISDVTGSGTSRSMTVTINNEHEYVNYYNTDIADGHTLDSGDRTIVFKHDGSAWVPDEGESPLVLNVMCDAGPDAPTEEQISELFADKITVSCNNDAANHGNQPYGLIADSYDATGEVKEGANGYVFPLIIKADKYVERFGNDVSCAHVRAKSQSAEILVQLLYDIEEGAWKLSEPSTVNIAVTCVNVPSYEDINNAFGNELVKIVCNNVKSGHEPKTYEAKDGGVVLNGSLALVDGVFNYTFTVFPEAYVYQYVIDTGVLHTCSDEAKSVTMAYDFDKGAWTVEDNSPIEFTVMCDDTSDVDVPTLSEDEIEILLRGAVNVSCVNDKATHSTKSATYGVADVEGGYAFLGIGSNGTNYTATIEIYSGQFINTFESDCGNVPHRLDDEKDTKTVTLVYDGKDWVADDAKVTFNVICNDGSDTPDPEPAGTIKVTPANMTIYEGGESGYEGVVDRNGTAAEAASLPEPMYNVTAPEGVDPDGMTITNGENTWTVTETMEDGLYTLEPTEGSDEVRVQYKDDGTIVTKDEFQATEDSFNELTTAIFDGDTVPSATDANGTRYAVETGEGVLTVRAVDEPDNAATLTDVTNSAPQQKLREGSAVAVAESTTEYTLNETDVVVDDTTGISLLFDGIIDDDVNRTRLLEQEIDGKDYIDDGFKSEIRYLDLVDNHNGNAWVKSSEGVDIYWAYPEGTDQSTDFKILHFSGLHRDGDKSGFNPNDITNTTLVDVTDDVATDFEKTANGIKFHVAEGNFSPYALVWDYDNGGGNQGGGGGTATKYYKIEASAGEGGSISPSGTVSVREGADKTFTIKPDEGYTIGNVVIDGHDYRQLGSSYTFEDVRADHTISVTFMRGNDPASPDETGVSDWLNASDHIAFLHGYGDGSFTFGPENPMTRAEVAQMFYNLLLDKSMGERDVAFEDVPDGAYYAEPVRVLASRGILNGTSPETFEPNRAITRAEFVAISMRFSNGEFDGENPYVDVPEDAWYRDYVVGATSFGWIYGYQDGSGRFGPDDTITRGQATMVTNRMLWRSCDTVWATEHLDELKTFVDLGRGHYAFFDVVEATNAHDYERVGDTRFEDWTGLRE